MKSPAFPPVARDRLIAFRGVLWRVEREDPDGTLHLRSPRDQTTPMTFVQAGATDAIDPDTRRFLNRSPHHRIDEPYRNLTARLPGDLEEDLWDTTPPTGHHEDTPRY